MKCHNSRTDPFVVNSAGVIQAQYSYDPYGRQTLLSGTLNADFGYAGMYNHQPSGLNLTFYRAYNPDFGRWLSRDPMAEQAGLNLYDYVGNNPINSFDPLGLWNYWAPWTWGVPTGMGTSIWNSLNPFDASAGWGGFSLENSAQGAEAFLDGINPFGNPFANNGFYDPCDKGLQWSKRIGGWTRDAELTLAPGGLLHYAGDLPLIGDESYLFGKGTGLLNNNPISDIFRVGWGLKGSVPSIVVFWG